MNINNCILVYEIILILVYEIILILVYIIKLHYKYWGQKNFFYWLNFLILLESFILFQNP